MFISVAAGWSISTRVPTESSPASRCRPSRSRRSSRCRAPASASRRPCLLAHEVDRPFAIDGDRCDGGDAGLQAVFHRKSLEMATRAGWARGRINHSGTAPPGRILFDPFIFGRRRNEIDQPPPPPSAPPRRPWRRWRRPGRRRGPAGAPADLEQAVAIDTAVTGIEKRAYWAAVYRRYGAAGAASRSSSSPEAGRVVGFVIGEGARLGVRLAAPAAGCSRSSVDPRRALAGIGTKLLREAISEHRSAAPGDQAAHAARRDKR